MNNLTLIIPAKQESQSLPAVLEELKKFRYKIDVVLHTTDIETIQSIKNYNVNIIYQKNFGYGDALIEGINMCTTEYFCIFNADGSFDPAELDGMYQSTINKKLDLLFASRYQTNSGSEDDTIVTFVGNYIFTLIGKIFFKLNITDILYTFVMGRTDKAKQLNLVEKKFAFCVELPIKAKKLNMNIMSISSHERKRIAGIKKVNAFKDGFQILTYMIKKFFNSP
ncbi:glycosyltransferase family 2 protein [Candidatus Pelagibacter sp.]|jgi:glycosyltransferase involved in cell wall biosynthesis|nr:glycosyltransferase family 2 protein [Candidatus Pelagibacter sp.]